MKNKFFKEDDRNKPPDKAVKNNTKVTKEIKNIDLKSSSYADYSMEELDAKLADLEKELRLEFGDDELDKLDKLYGHKPSKQKAAKPKAKATKPKAPKKKPIKKAPAKKSAKSAKKSTKK